VGTSLLGRIDKKKKNVVGSASNNKAPSSLQIYKDVNRALGIGFKVVFGWLGVDIDKYLRRKPHQAKKGKKKSLLGRIGI
jgi:hypothetical protein